MELLQEFLLHRYALLQLMQTREGMTKMGRMIDEDDLIKQFNRKDIEITFDIPVEEVLGEDVDLDDFSSLVQDAIMAYRKMAIDTIKSRQTAYDVDKVVEQMEEFRDEMKMFGCDGLLSDLIEVVKGGGVDAGSI